MVERVGEEVGRIAAFHEDLERRGLTRPFKGVLEQWTYTPLQETERAGLALRQRLDVFMSA